MTNIAKIRLAPGESGYYDDISKISLNWKRPETTVPEGTNCSGLIKSVKARRLIVVEGDLGEDQSLKKFLSKIKKQAENSTVNNSMVKSQEAITKTFTIDTDDKSTITIDTNISQTSVSLIQEDNKKENVENTENVNQKTEPLTVSPKSIRSLAVDEEKIITTNHDVNSIKIADEEIISVTFEGKTITVQGLAIGKTYILIETSVGNYTLSVNVKN